MLALVLTYWAVGLAYTPITFQQLTTEDKKEQAQKAPETTAPAPAESPDEARAIRIPVVTGDSFRLFAGAAGADRVRSLPGGLLSALIIGIGMRQAWQMTAVPPLQISGPYRIATAASSSAV